jgi:hypothetical protein
MIFGQEVHYVMIKKPSKFQANLVHGFRENQYSHLQPFLLYLEIRASDGSDFWHAEVLGP